jgi:hypothetical protein
MGDPGAGVKRLIQESFYIWRSEFNLVGGRWQINPKHILFVAINL